MTVGALAAVTERKGRRSDVMAQRPGVRRRRRMVRGDKIPVRSAPVQFAAADIHRLSRLRVGGGQNRERLENLLARNERNDFGLVGLGFGLEDILGDIQDKIGRKRRDGLAIQAAPERRPHHPVRGDLLAPVLRIFLQDENRLGDVGQGVVAAMLAGKLKRMGARSLDATGALARPRARVTRRAGEVLEVHNREPLVAGNRRAEASRALGGDAVRQIVPQVAAPAGQRGDGRAAALVGLDLVAARNLVVQAVTVTVRADESGRKVHILVPLPFLRAAIAHRVVGVAEVAAGGRGLVHVEEHLLFVIELRLVIQDAGAALGGGLGVRLHVGVVGFRHFACGAAHLCQAARRRRRPHQVLLGDVQAPLNRVAGRVGAVAQEAVDFEFPGDRPSGVRVVAWFAGELFARPAAGHVAAEAQDEPPGRQADGLGPVRARPRAIGKRQLHASLAADPDPGLSGPAGSGLGVRGAEVPAAAYRLVVVTIAARRACGKGNRRVRVRGDFVLFGIVEGNAVDIGGAAGGLGHRLRLLARLSGGGVRRRGERDGKGGQEHQVASASGQTWKSSGLKSRRMAASTALLTARTTTALS